MSFWYLASPYSKYPHGIEEAYRMVCREHARLIMAGVPVFCPIAHTHGPAIHGNIDPLAHEIWIPADKPFMDAACGLIMLTAESWEQSYGMRVERDAFLAAGKPVVWMTPGEVPLELLPMAA